MKSKLFFFIGLITLALAAAPRLTAANFQYKDIRISSQAPLQGKSKYGYVEYSFIIHNSSMTDSHKVTLEMPYRDLGYGTRIYPLSRTVSVPPKSNIKVSLYQPYISLNGHIVRVIIDGWDRSLPAPLNFSPCHITRYSSDINILITKAAMSKNPPELKSDSPYTYILSNIPVSEWSDNWLAFSRFPMIIVTGDDLDRMSPGTRTALINYAECGGILLTDGSFAGMKSWKELKSESGDWDIYSAGFGKIIIADKPFKKIRRKKWNKIYMMSYASKGTMNTDISVNSANISFPVVKVKHFTGHNIYHYANFRIHNWPGQYFYFITEKRKIWLLWTVPAGALLFTIVLLIYALASESWGGHTRSRTLTVLDENARRAISFGRLAYFYPIPPSGGLMFSPYTEVGTFGTQQSGRVYAVDWTNGQHFKSGWFVAKTPCQLILRKNEPRRERLDVHRHNGKLSVTNGIGVHIEYLTVWDFDGKKYVGKNIKPGEKIELKPEKCSLQLKNSHLSPSFSDNLVPDINFKLMWGSYTAKLKSNPFVEPGREFSANHKEEATLIGIMRKEDAK